MKKINSWVIVIFFIASLVSFQGCATEKVAIKIEKSLPPSKLAYYNDNFDKLKEDLWEKAGYLSSEEQVANFKPADMRIENGKLRIETQMGHFSKGGLASKYALRGDFDIQVDCHIDFLEGLQDMDHMLNFLVVHKSKEVQATDYVTIGLSKRGTLYKSYIFSSYAEKGKYHRGKVQEIGNFRGTLRILRSGNHISTLYKKEGGKEWKKMNTFRSTSKDIMLGLKLQNFFVARTYIKARSPITAIFDNFRINAAEGIIEEEI
ncbi:MAG TPA: hypothetical protein VMW09_06740 [Desulfatiglandales bacterium]|nr:hypothetical protein [Desulfatiglandales bacterium]